MYRLYEWEVGGRELLNGNRSFHKQTIWSRWHRTREPHQSNRVGLSCVESIVTQLMWERERERQSDQFELYTGKYIYIYGQILPLLDLCQHLYMSIHACLWRGKWGWGVRMGKEWEIRKMIHNNYTQCQSIESWNWFRVCSTLPIVLRETEKWFRSICKMVPQSCRLEGRT